jgi:hypothetical protein
VHAVWEFKAICLWYTEGYKIVLHLNTFKDKKRKWPEIDNSFDVHKYR